MSLTEKVEDAYIQVVGNRVTAAATVATVSSAGPLGLFLESLFSTEQTNPLLTVAYATGFVVTSLIATGYLMETKCGTKTQQYYRRTEKHIKKYNQLKPRVVELWMTRTTENQATYGYCQQQGIYLAAKKHGQLDAFYEAKRKVSRVKIPHF